MAHARDLIADEIIHTTEMHMKEWLHRLNLLNLYKNFKKHKFTRVNQLKSIREQQELDDNELTESNRTHSKRMWEMLTGHDEAKENFKYLSKHGLRQVAMQYLDKEREITELVDSVPEKALTGFHLRDILAFKTNFATIRTKILDTVLFNMRFGQKLYHFKSQRASDENETLLKSKKKVINFDLKQYFTDQGAPEIINKLLKEDMNDAELFFKMGFDKVSEMCLKDIKQEGKKIRITKSLKEYFEKYEKDGAVEYHDAGLSEKP